MVRCVARQGGPAWFVHDILSVSAQGAGGGIYTPDNLLRLGSRLGLDVKALDTCLADPTVAADVRAETAQGTALGLTAGPSVVIKAGRSRGRPVLRCARYGKGAGGDRRGEVIAPGVPVAPPVRAYRSAGLMMPRRIANLSSSTRSWKPSFSMMFAR